MTFHGLLISLKFLNAHTSTNLRCPFFPHTNRNTSTNQKFVCRFARACEGTKVLVYSNSKTNYTVVRPLINCSRRFITMSCILSKLPVYPDVSNLKVRYSRNRIRKQIIPSLQLFFNPKVEKNLFKFSEFYNRHISSKKRCL